MFNIMGIMENVVNIMGIMEFAVTISTIMNCHVNKMGIIRNNRKITCLQQMTMTTFQSVIHNMRYL